MKVTNKRISFFPRLSREGLVAHDRIQSRPQRWRLSTCWKALLVWAGLVICLSACSPEKPPETLRILAWPGYADADLVAVFEQRYQVNVEVSFSNTDDELWSRINANDGQDFDVFAANTAELQRYHAQNLIQPIDVEKVTNLRHQLPRFRDLTSIPGVTQSGQVFAVPYTYSEMGLIYNLDLVTEKPDSMSAMWDPRYQGQVLAYDGSSHNFTMTALTLGLTDPFNLQDEDFARVTRRLVELRRNVLTFYSSPEEAVNLYRRNSIALVYGNYGRQQVKQLRDAGANIGYTVPKEGALGWLDCWAITRKARNKALAELWINYSLEPEVSNALSERQGLPNTVSAESSSHPEEKIIWLRPVENYQRRADLWERIRSGDVLEQIP